MADKCRHVVRIPTILCIEWITSYSLFSLDLIVHVVWSMLRADSIHLKELWWFNGHFSFYMNIICWMYTVCVCLCMCVCDREICIHDKTKTKHNKTVYTFHETRDPWEICSVILYRHATIQSEIGQTGHIYHKNIRLIWTIDSPFPNSDPARLPLYSNYLCGICKYRFKNFYWTIVFDAMCVD